MGNDTKHINIGLYLWTEHADILRQAAEKAHTSVPNYIRATILPIAARDIGVSLPELPYQRRGNVPSDKIARLEEAASAIMEELAAIKNRARVSGLYSTRPEKELKKSANK